MDLIRSGKFIQGLRTEMGLTQEELGEKIGVSNKTISRWETGTYLPPADMLLSMSELFGVSINEILSGKHLTPEEYRKAAEDNLKETLGASTFSLKEKVDYYKKKWLREHIAVMLLIGICIIAIFTFGFMRREPLLGSVAVLLLGLAHGWRNNAMMAYVEKHAYDGSGKW